MAVTVFKQSPLKAFTQSALRARGVGGVTNPTEEGQVLFSETEAASIARKDGLAGPPDAPSVEASPLAAITAVKAADFSIFPVLPYAGGNPVPVYQYPPTPLFNTNYDDDQAPNVQFDIATIWPLVPNQTLDGGGGPVTLPSGIQRKRGIQYSFWIYSCDGFSTAGVPFWTNHVHAQRVRFRINSSQLAFLASFDFWVAGIDAFPPGNLGRVGWDRTIDQVNNKIVLNPPKHFAGYVIRNVHVLSAFTVQPFVYVEVPFPENTIYSGGWINGMVGSGVFCVYGETPAQWSARTGIAMT